MNKTFRIYDLGKLLQENDYPGRGIIAGKSADGKNAVFVYFIMGRSENSRNRVFVETEDGVVIYPYDESKVEDPSLIIYSPVKRQGRENWIVTNGDQTETIFSALENGITFEKALEGRSFEPDAPNFTPRISALLNISHGTYRYKMSILKSGDSEGTLCNRFTYSYAPINGLGHFIHTYKHNGNPLPSFEGEPVRVSIPDDIDQFGDYIWTRLNCSNRISMVVHYIPIDGGTGKSISYNINRKDFKED